MAKDLTGHRFGRLTPVSRVANAKGGKPRWLCRCDCGHEKIVLAEKMTSGHTRSCGCLHLESARQKGRANATHGMAGSPTYASWRAMHYRCRNPRSKDFPRYGAVGITVCDRWAKFQAFLGDMGARPSLQHSIDRIDGAKGYEPSNCRWATAVEQTMNSAVPKLDREAVREIREDDRPYAEIAEEHGVSRAAVCMARSGKTWKHA